MKKLAIISIALAITLSGCAVRTDDSSVSPPSWAEAYFYALYEHLQLPFEFSRNRISGIQLIDLNFDGVPEMLLIEKDLHNFSVSNILSYRNGEVIEIDTGFTMPTNFSFARNKETGELTWIADEGTGGAKGGWGHMWESFEFADVSIKNRGFLFSYFRVNRFPCCEDYILGGANYTYSFSLNGEDWVEASPEEIEVRRSEVFAEFETIPTQQLRASIFELVYDDTVRFVDEVLPEHINRERLMEFFSRWE